MGLRRQDRDVVQQRQRPRSRSAAQRRIAWPVFSIIAAGGIALALLEPGDVAYWTSTIAVIPLIYVAIIEFEEPWRAASRRARAAVWTAAAALAAAGLTSNVVLPGARSFIIGGLMVVPLIVLLAPIITRGANADDTPLDDLGAGGIFGPPS
jgi:hypothetical protein